MNNDKTCIIAVKFNEYEELFYEFDNKPIHNRRINDDLDTFIKDSIDDVGYIKDFSIKLIISLPKKIYNSKLENAVKNSILDFYFSKIELENSINRIGLRRLVYYFLSSFLFFTSWYYIQKYLGDKFFSEILNTCGTVILWQAVTLIFIENKNYVINKRINRILASMDIVFNYY